ncbi:unnamed protein product [Rotaria magnacalcarata]|uniref:Uncharacterized protein n=1 Tax=Rotaria magnacalcarata TaxID=392030 RepID=A0A818X3B2_9BILA|nr:unnamed protein product [Rotaria magnacalcarata]CAF3732018.1 unnamed protein product [Rotaria magnacalcarata]
MYTTKSSYCSCSTCTEIRNDKPKHSRYTNLLRYLLVCSCCSSKNKLMLADHQTSCSSLDNSRISAITFRDVDVSNKHCSKHDVMIKASRPYFSKFKNEELRQRVKDANQRWKRMSILPANFIDFIFKNKDFVPLCTICYENLSLLQFNLCHRCITTSINYQQLIQQATVSQSIIEDDRNTLSTISNTTILNYDEDSDSEELEEFFIDCME